MVSDMEQRYRYDDVRESELDELLAGKRTFTGMYWERWQRLPHLSSGSFGVLSIEGKGEDQPVRPLALVAREDDFRRLFGRYAQVRSDLSPITAWCHLLTPRFSEALDSLTRIPDLGGMEAAWAGLIVAESVLITEKPISSVRISSCFATQTFAIGRANALWSHISISDIRERFDAANRFCKSESVGLPRGETRLAKIRMALEPILETLTALSNGRNSTKSGFGGPLIEALEQLRRARSHHDPNEAAKMFDALRSHAPEAESLEQLPNLTPEMRLRLFDQIVQALNAETGTSELRQSALALLAGYLATVAAGGAPSLSLAEQIAGQRPEITAWAYLIGGIGENVVWTSSFDGLGRLVARELLRPFRLEDSPTCDFAFEEANTLVDPKLLDPLVYLRIKQARSVTVALFPGVNIAISLGESIQQAGTKSDAVTANRPSNQPVTQRDPLSAFADALWPYLQPRVGNFVRSIQSSSYGSRSGEGSSRAKDKRRSGSQSELPLNESKRYRP